MKIIKVILSSYICLSLYGDGVITTLAQQGEGSSNGDTGLGFMTTDRNLRGGGRGGGRWGHGHYNSDNDDGSSHHDLIQNLLDHRHLIQRNMTLTENGFESYTYSNNEEVGSWIQQHVQQMIEFMATGQRIRQRDPLFRSLFDHAHVIDMQYDPDVIETASLGKGVFVTESSTDPCAVALIQAHGETVGKFIELGRTEARRNHNVPNECD